MERAAGLRLPRRGRSTRCAARSCRARTSAPTAASSDRFRELKPDVVHTHSPQGRHHRPLGGPPGEGAGASSTRSTAWRSPRRRRALVNASTSCSSGAPPRSRPGSSASPTRCATSRSPRDIGRPAQYVTVYSGMETAPFLNPPVPRRARSAHASASRTDDVVVGTIARLFHLKGHDDLLDLAPDLCRRFPEPALPLGRRRPAARAVRSSASPRWACSDRFILTGLVPPTRIPELSNAMDILVHPSPPRRPRPRAAQGRLAGVPGHHLRHRRQPRGPDRRRKRLLLPPFDKGKLGEKLAALLDDPDQRQRWARRCAFALVATSTPRSWSTHWNAFTPTPPAAPTPPARSRSRTTPIRHRRHDA